MKKLSVVVFSLVLLAAFVAGAAFSSPVSAQSGPKPKNTPGAKATEKAALDALTARGAKEHYKGTILQVDAGSMLLALKDGTEVSMAIAPETDIKVKRAGKNAGPEALQPNMVVVVQAVRMEDGSLTSLRIHALPSKPGKVHRVGLVMDYQPDASITIRDKNGGETTFSLIPETKILPEDRTGELVPGVRVTIICPRDPEGGALIAQGIVIHPEGEELDDEVETPGS